VKVERRIDTIYTDALAREMVASRLPLPKLCHSIILQRTQVGLAPMMQVSKAASDSVVIFKNCVC
jgi:hypothetical protein